MAVLDNKISDQQGNGRFIQPHSTLSATDVERILDSEYCNPNNSEGNRNWLSFVVGLDVGLRTTELPMIKLSQL